WLLWKSCAAAQLVQRSQQLVHVRLREGVLVDVTGRTPERDLPALRGLWFQLVAVSLRPETLRNVEDAVSGGAKLLHELLRPLEAEVPVDNGKADDVVAVPRGNPAQKRRRPPGRRFVRRLDA